MPSTIMQLHKSITPQEFHKAPGPCFRPEICVSGDAGDSGHERSDMMARLWVGGDGRQGRKEEAQKW